MLGEPPPSYYFPSHAYVPEQEYIRRQKPLFCQKEISPKSIMVQLYDFLQLWNIKEPKCISFKVLEQEVVVKAFKFFSSLAHPI